MTLRLIGWTIFFQFIEVLDKNIGNVDVAEGVVFFLVVPEAVIAIRAQRQNLFGLYSAERHQADLATFFSMSSSPKCQ